MSTIESDAERTIRDFIDRTKKGHAEFDLDTPLYAGSIGLDSLETAELSALLEDEFGTDPYSAGHMPQSVGEILAFYRSTTVTEP